MRQIYEDLGNAYNAYTNGNIEEMQVAIVDVAADCISLCPYGAGVVFSIYWTAFDGRNKVLQAFGL